MFIDFFDVSDVGYLDEEFTYPKNKVEYSKFKLGEIYFITNYIEALGYELKWTIQDSDNFRNSLFIVVDNEMINLF